MSGSGKFHGGLNIAKEIYDQPPPTYNIGNTRFGMHKSSKSANMVPLPRILTSHDASDYDRTGVKILNSVKFQEPGMRHYSANLPITALPNHRNEADVSWALQTHYLEPASKLLCAYENVKDGVVKVDCATQHTIITPFSEKELSLGKKGPHDIELRPDFTANCMLQKRHGQVESAFVVEYKKRGSLIERKFDEAFKQGLKQASQASSSQQARMKVVKNTRTIFTQALRKQQPHPGDAPDRVLPCRFSKRLAAKEKKIQTPKPRLGEPGSEPFEAHVAEVMKQATAYALAMQTRFVVVTDWDTVILLRFTMPKKGDPKAQLLAGVGPICRVTIVTDPRKKRRLFLGFWGHSILEPGNEK